MLRVQLLNVTVGASQLDFALNWRTKPENDQKLQESCMVHTLTTPCVRKQRLLKTILSHSIPCDLKNNKDWNKQTLCNTPTQYRTI